MSIKIKVLGSGHANCNPEFNFNSMYLIQFKCAGEGTYKNLLLDCGKHFQPAVFYHKLNYWDIDGVYISHLHGDHIGGLEDLAFGTYFAPPQFIKKPKIFGKAGILRELWEGALRAGLSSLAAHQIRDGKVVSQLDTYFEPIALKGNDSFEFEGVNFTPVQMIHIVNGYNFMDTYGLIIDTGFNKIFWTSDSQFAPDQIKGIYKQVDMIWGDCETAPWRSGVHSHYDDWKTLAPEIKAKTWLTHTQDNPPQDAIGDGFAGFLKRGQEFDIN